jgi:hypothetical protein
MANASVASPALPPDPPTQSPARSRLVAIRVVAACFGVAALSLLVPYAMRSDPWAWLVWGREVRHLALDTTQGPSWKPLAVLLTSVLSLFGNAAPDLLLLVCRAAWLLAAVLAFRIGKRLAGRTAGAIAAAGLVLIPSADADWLGLVLEGSCEPLVTVLVLAAIDRHLAGRRTQALALGCLAALGRPEAWPLAVIYGLAVWRAERRGAVVVALLGSVPALWLGGAFWGSGSPFGAAQRAHSAFEAAASRHGTVIPSPARGALAALENAGQILILPYLVAALFAVGQAVLRVRRDGDRCDRVTIALGAVSVGWIAIFTTGALMGLPAEEQFMLAPAAVLSVLGGVGFVQIVRRFPQGHARLVAGGVLGVAALGFALPRFSALLEQARPRPDNRQERGALITVLQRSEAKTRVARCGGEVVVVKGSPSQVSYRLGVSLPAVRQWKPGRPEISRGILIARNRDPGWEPKQVPGLVASDRAVRRLATVHKLSVYEVGCRPNL